MISRWVKPKPFVKRRNAFEVNERVGPSGAVIERLDEAQVRALADTIAAKARSNSIAVVLMHSYLAPEHEFLIKKIFAERAPNIPVSISYEVLPKWKEHFRSSTTICDAFIKPVVEPAAPLDQRASEETRMSAPKSWSCARMAAR